MRRHVVLALVLLTWAALSIPKLNWPFRDGHDAFISSQLGQYAHNHVHLGLTTTRGANLTAVDHSGNPRFYYSYTPLASWLLAIPMALGVPFHPAVRATTLCLSILFIVGLWFFAGNVWGLRIANTTAALLLMMPIMNTYYGLSAIWEIMALGPLFCALALFSSRRPRDTWWFLGVTIFGVCSVCLSWICWLVVVPCAYRELRAGRRAAGLAAGLTSVLVPVIWQLLALDATGITVATFLSHNMQRMAATQWDSASPVLGHWQILIAFGIRSAVAFGPVLLGVSGLGMIYVARSALRRNGRGVPGGGGNWLLMLVAFGVPLNLLARNVATYHDFFPILFAPVVAIATAIVVLAPIEQCAGNGKRNAQMWACLVLLVAVFTTTVWESRNSFVPGSDDYTIREVAIELGDAVEMTDALIVSPEFLSGELRSRPPLTIADRDFRVKPQYVALTPKTGLLCYDSSELSVLAREVGSRRCVVLYEGNRLEPLPQGYHRQRIGSYVVAISGPRVLR